MKNAQKILTAVIVGTAAGLVTGILLAPDTGAVTRQRIVDGTKKLGDDITEFANSGISAMAGAKQKLFRNNDSVSESRTQHHLS